jgi:hypothetical protein
MSIRWKPFCYQPNENYSPGEYWSKQSKTKSVEYPTYAELKKDLPKLIKNCDDPEGLLVIRSKRGEWGEWTERWKMVDGKPKIIRQLWN